MHPTEKPEDIHEPGAQAPDEASPEATEEEASPSWWGRMTDRLFRREEQTPPPEEPQSEAESGRRMVDDSELQRLVQSEADRREAARNKEARDAERKRLRDEDPWALA